MNRQFISGVLVFASSAMLAAQAPTRYDRTAEKVFTGTVKAVVSFAAPDGNVGVHFDLKTEDGIVSVHVAPAMYIGSQNFWFYADDKLEIIGARVSNDDNAAIWAKAIQKGSALLVLRNDDGTPKWTPAIDGTDGCGVAHPPLQRGTER